MGLIPRSAVQHERSKALRVFHTSRACPEAVDFSAAITGKAFYRGNTGYPVHTDPFRVIPNIFAIRILSFKKIRSNRMLSMTGYGSGQATQTSCKVDVYINSVNRKQTDIRISVPKDLTGFEKKIRDRVGATITRGAVTVRVDFTCKSPGDGQLYLDATRARAAWEELISLQKTLEIPGDISIQDLLSVPGLMGTQAAPLSPDELSSMIESALAQALEELIATKTAEGKSICDDLRLRHKILVNYADEISGLAPQSAIQYRERLLSKVREIIDDIDFDDDRIAKEIAVYSDRCDIAEETTRISSHLGLLNELLSEDEPVGRKMDFLIQELFREINTVGSKANNVDISKIVIDFKTELERIREQTQNIE